MVYGQLVFAGGNNITLSQSVTAQSATITISGANSGTTVFSAGISTIGNTSGTTGLVSNQLILAGGNNVTLSQSVNGGSATVTISVGGGIVPTLSIWQNAGGTITPAALTANTFYLVGFDPKNGPFPGNMTVSSAFVNVSETSNVTANVSGTLKLGIYTRNVSTLSILNSASTTWAFSSGANNSSLMSGARWISFDASLFSASLTFSNTDYYLGYLYHTSGADPSLSMIGFSYLSAGATRSGTFGAASSTGNSSQGWEPFVGVSVSSLSNTAPLPASVQLGELDKTPALYGFVPHIVLENISSNF